jgi:Cohesin domain
MLSRRLEIMQFSRGTVAIVAAALAGVALAARPAAAQDDNAVRVNIGIAAAKPGDPIDIPLTLSGNENVAAGSILMHIDFPKKLLTYTDSERGLAVELSDGEVKVTASDDKSDPTQTELEFSAKGKNPIKPGILGYLKFTVSDSAQKGIIVLKVKDTTATTPAGGNLQLAKGDDGQLTIFALDETIPVVGCFFFTH